MALETVVHNPPSLGLLSACRIRKSISCMGKNVERDLVENLSSGDYDALRDPNVPVSLEDMCKYLYLILRTLRSLRS